MTKNTLKLGIIFFLLAAIPIGIYLAKRTQIFRPKAVETTTTCTQPTLPLTVGILVLEYYPRDPQNSSLLDDDETGWREQKSISFWEDKTNNMVTQGLGLVNDATKYHGYKDQNAPQFLNYTVTDRKKFYNPIPRGYQLSNRPNYRPGYGQILRDLSICNYVDNQGVREVWMYGYHNDNTVVPDESRMSSRFGDISNSYPHEEYIPDSLKMPVCNKAYVLYNFTYNPDGNPGNNLHNRLHQVENQIPFAEGTDKWPPRPRVNTERGQSIFWGNFSEYVQDYTQRNYRSACGNGHITPNWTDHNTQGYRYDLSQQGEFNCETWHPDPLQSTFINAGCDRWSCTDIGFYKWYLQNIPGYNNGIIYQGKQMRNWWESFYDFDAFVEKGRSLFGDSIFSCNTAPTATPTSTPPTLTPTPTDVSTPTPTSTLTPTSPPAGGSIIRGDADGNGCISLSDFNLWLRVFTGTSTDPEDRRKADVYPAGSGDNIINILDFNVWLNSYLSGGNRCSN